MAISYPNVPQGVLNRLKTSILYDDYPQLNVTPSYMGKAAASIAFESDFTTEIETMTGLVQSSEPFIMVTLTLNLLRTQPLAAAYQAQGQINTVFGGVTVRTDVTPGGILPYYFYNMAWKNLRELPLAGTDPGFPVIIRGYYPINLALYNS